MPTELILNKTLSAALVMGFFLAVIFFLRFLYGPKGKLRDPEWDRWNEQARLEQEKEREARSFAALRETFLGYARGFFTGDEAQDHLLRLKIDHSLRVLAHAELLLAEEGPLREPVTARALKVAALFHDVGRFEQLKRYHTFADALSVNHGVLGARVIREQDFLKDESPQVRRLVLPAVAAHNRFALPEAVKGPLRLVLEALRDADKVDILRVMAEHVEPGKPLDDAVFLHLDDAPASCSPAIMEALEQGRVALYSDMRFVNDFRLLLCTWLWDLHFAASLRVVRQEGRYEAILAGLDAVPEARDKARALVAERLGRD